MTTKPFHFNLITNPSTFHIVNIVSKRHMIFISENLAENLLFLRVDIPQNLGHSSNGVSPATLWLSGHMYPITLNGSPDG